MTELLERRQDKGINVRKVLVSIFLNIPYTGGKRWEENLRISLKQQQKDL